MATRTLNQNNFYFSIIADIHKQAMEKHITVENSEYLRKGLKENDDNYPKKPHFIEDTFGEVEDRPISSAKLTTKEMVNHIEFIIEFVGRFGITPKFVKDEWDRLMQSAHK